MIPSLLQLLHEVNNLKYTYRHSFGTDDRQESVAEHTWRMAFMAMLLAPHLHVHINLERVLKMALVHDINEAYVGDVPAQFAAEHAKQSAREHANMQDLIERFAHIGMQDIADLWEEYERAETWEAKFVKALDKIEVRLQHNENPIDTWSEIEFPRALYAADKYCQFDAFIQDFNEQVKAESATKISQAGYDIQSVQTQADVLRG